jgi:hypothetical protein
MDPDTQKFVLQKPSGPEDLGDYEIEGRSQEDVWHEIAVNNSRFSLVSLD